jgi:hypothetical protein
MPATAITPAPETHDASPDGDIRYRPDIQGQPRDVRARLRDAQHQVALLVTARARDNNTAVQELLPDVIERTIERIEVVSRLMNAGYAGPGDVRAEYASLAATAIACAEAVDRPHALGGIRLRRASGTSALRVG